jgi:glutamate racemase
VNLSPVAKNLLSRQSPIGIFDSGLGGLSVTREIRALLPNEDLVYVADSAHVPYGGKPQEFIKERSFQLTQFLLERGAKTIVIACNTATAAAVAELRAALPELPIVGMEPAIKPAVRHTQVGRVGILATSGTIDSASSIRKLLGSWSAWKMGSWIPL